MQINSMTENSRHTASFKDPSGFIFQVNGVFHRQINKSYAEEYELLMSSGLYQALVEKKLLLAHKELNNLVNDSPDYYKTILPEQLPFISYPYEWSFDQLKDAALLTLRVARIALKKDMMLKDATPFNIQFYQGSPVFIDTLSFEKCDFGKPWIAYRQFCETFLFPLLLEYYLKIDVQKWLSVYLEGIPVKTTAVLLPIRSRLNLGVWLNVYLQNNIQSKGTSGSVKSNYQKDKMLRLLEHLTSIIKKINISAALRSTWNNYYDETILSQDYLKAKEEIFRSLISDIRDCRVLDLGCNDGYFSKIIAEGNNQVISADFDSQCINRFYNQLKTEKRRDILPLCIDISNPPPATGFRNTERHSFLERIPSDAVAALALIHHLVLSKNILLSDAARLFSELTKKWLIIEFVPLQDEKAQQLIANKSSFHEPYDIPSFKESFLTYFEIEKEVMIPGTERVLFKMIKRPF
jgi:hypothetical protein